MAKITIRVPTKADLETAHRKAILAILPLAVSIIARRTASGLGANGQPFRPYSRSYRLAKTASGRDSGRVDLTLTGQMLRNLKPKGVRADGVGLIGFDGVHRSVGLQAGRRAAFSTTDTKRAIRKRRTVRSSQTVPMAVIVKANHRLRPFFDIRLPAERRQLVEAYRRKFKQFLDEALRRKG